jgi:hypothetical protein
VSDYGPEIAPTGHIETPKGVYNAANRQDVKAKEKAQKLREDGKIEAFGKLMGTTYGRAVVYDILLGAGVWLPAGSPDFNSNALWFREGVRQTGLDINGQAWRANPEGYKLMLSENFAPPTMR